MAQLYVGNTESVDRSTLDALRRLPDDYVVLAEFRIPRTSRQVDFFVAHINQPTCSLFLVEAKNESRRLRGTVDGVWDYEDETRPGIWLPYPPPNERDKNPMQQAVNTANALKDWIISMQAILQAEDPAWNDPRENLTVFPRLLLPHAHPHNRLQTDRFVFRYDSHDDLIDGLQRFVGRRPMAITRGMIERMTEQFGLRGWQAPAAREPENTQSQLRQLTAQIAALQRDVADVKRMLQQFTNASGRQVSESPRTYEATPQTPDREAAFDLLVNVVHELRQNNQSRVFAAVNEEIRQLFGELPNGRIPFERFKDFLQEAQRRGKIRLVRVGPVDHILLPDESIGQYVEAVRHESDLVTSYDS